MRIKLITYEKTVLPIEEKFYIIDTEECKGYDIKYDTISNGKSTKVEKEELRVYFNNGTVIRKDFCLIAEFFVDGEEIIRNGSFTDNYQLILFNKRLATKVDDEDLEDDEPVDIDKIINEALEDETSYIE